MYKDKKAESDYHKKYSYKDGRHCPICGVPISNRANSCSLHTLNRLNSSLRLCICKVCGKKFSVYLTNSSGKYCSKKCENKSPETKLNRSRNGEKTRFLHQKLSDSELLDKYNKVLTGEIETLSQAFRTCGYARIPPKRLVKLIGFEVYQQNNVILSIRYKRKGVNFMGLKIQRRGYLTELEAMKIAESLGYMVFRSGGSKGAADIFLGRGGQGYLVQIKSSVREYNVEHYYKKDIDRLRELDFGMRKMLWVKVLYKGWKYYMIHSNTVELVSFT